MDREIYFKTRKIFENDRKLLNSKRQETLRQVRKEYLLEQEAGGLLRQFQHQHNDDYGDDDDDSDDDEDEDEDEY